MLLVTEYGDLDRNKFWALAYFKQPRSYSGQISLSAAQIPDLYYSFYGRFSGVYFRNSIFYQYPAARAGVLLLGRISRAEASVRLHAGAFGDLFLRDIGRHIDLKFLKTVDGELCFEFALFVRRILRDHLFFRALRLRAA